MSVKRDSGIRALSIGLAVLTGCEGKPPPEPTGAAAPAKVSGSAKEADLAGITLSPKAESRLGIETTIVETRRMSRSRTLGGEIIVPPGRRITVHAPLAGTILPPPDNSIVAPGGHLSIGQCVLRLSPAFLSDGEVLAPSDRISLARARADLAAAVAQAKGEVAGARVEEEAAEVKLQRAATLREDNVGSLRMVQEAEAEVALARAREKAAKLRLGILERTNLDAEAGRMTSLPITSPQDGVLLDVYALPGEPVAASAQLFVVAGIDPVWVRVSVYAGDVDRIDLQQPVGITDLSFDPRASVRLAEPVSAPPSANADAATVDLFYRLANPQAELLPGTRVGVRLKLKTDEEYRVLPWSAVLFDFNGGTWVYENTAPHVFVHRRVEVRWVADGMAVLGRGPAPGAKIVTTGAAELFGTEFGGGK